MLFFLLGTKEGSGIKHGNCVSLQRVQGWDKRYQYLLFAAEPYEIISFKVSITSFCLPYWAKKIYFFL